MPSFLRRILSGHGSKAQTARPEDETARSIAVAETTATTVASEPLAEVRPATELSPPSSNTVEPKLEFHQFKLNEHGLIPAEQLPSAAETLAELFPPEEDADPFSRGADDITNLEELPASEETPVEEDERSAGATEQSLNQATAETSNTEGYAVGEVFELENLRADRSEKFEIPALDSMSTDSHDSAMPLSAEDSSAESRDEDSAKMGESISPETSERSREAEDEEIAKTASIASLESPASSGRDWQLEERLASHLEWLDTRGQSGTRADLSDSNLEGQELIGVKLKFADLHDANLRAADLLLADLRDATLIRADLEDSCLVGANLEAANLEGASLETAMGLVPRQLAGANLRDALLPPHIMEFEAAGKFARASRLAWRCFAPLIPAVLISWLIIWKTKDAQLVTDSAVIPYLHSRTAAAALPTEQIFLLAPLVLFGLFLLFQFQLQKVWEAVLELPATFPDGHPLDDSGPGLVIGLLRAHFWWINREALSTRWVEKTFSVLAAYWVVPFTLLLFWARYLTMQDAKGTLLQALIVAIATGVALHATVKTGKTPEQWSGERKWTQHLANGVRAVSPAFVSGAVGFALLLLSIGTLMGVPHERSRAPQYSTASIRRWAADVFWAAGFDPYADLTEATLSQKPANWGAANSQVTAVKGPQLNETRFRYAQAYGVFLANAHLWQSDFEGAYLSEGDFRGADLGHSDLRRTILDGALLSGTNLNRARLDGAVLARADLRWANLSYASLSNAILVDSRFDGATLYDAQLFSASLARANLEKADLRGAFLNAANLDHADLQQALLWSAKLPGANLYGAKLQGAVAIDADFRGSDLREAQFAGTVLSDAQLGGANLDRADLRGALELTAKQVCASKSRQGALLDDALAMQVTALCGGLQ